MHTTTIEALRAGQVVELFRGWPQLVLTDAAAEPGQPGCWRVTVVDTDREVSTHRLPAGTLYVLAAEASRALVC